MIVDRDTLWRKYLNTCWAGGTPEQRRWAFGQWWKLEKAHAFATTKAELRATRKTQAKAIR